MLDNDNILRATLNSILDGVLVIDMNGKILCSNFIFAKIWGTDESAVQQLDEKKLIKIMLSKVSDPEKFTACLENINNISEGSVDEIQLNDGRIIQMHLRLLDYGEQEARVWIFRDISEQKQAEGQFKVFQFALEASSDAIGMSTAYGKHYYQNNAFDKLFGKIGDDPPGSIYCNESVGREVFDTIMAGRQWTGEVQMYAADGRVLDILLRAYAIKDTNGKVTNLVGVHTDITDRKLSEKELKRTRNYLSNIIDSMPSVLIGVDSNGWVTQWNAQAESQTGIAAYKAIGQPLNKLISYIEPDKILDAINTKKQQTIVKQAREEGGIKKYENITIFPLIADGIDGVVIRIDDVTEQVQIEESMVQNEKMLSLGGLAAGMAHEINNPLGGIIQNANVIRNRLTDSEMPANKAAAQEAGISMEQISRFMEARKITDGIERVLSSGKRAARIVDGMLGFSRKEDGKRTAQNMDEIVDKSLELLALDYDLKKSYDFKQIKIVREYEKYLPVVVCEAGKIQQVIVNILKNSAEAMQGHGLETPCIVLRLINEEDKNRIRIEIENNGPPMPEEVRKRVFEPFFTTKLESKGSGLGMSVSYFIISEIHGGDIWIESMGEKGTKFIVQLPLSN